MTDPTRPPYPNGPRTGGGAAGGRKPSRPVTPARLENIALHYLERFASSAENLRRVLMRRVQRSVAEHGTDGAEATAWVDALVARHVSSGLVNDTLYAEGRTASLRRRGASTRKIRMALAAKGVDADTVTSALNRQEEDTDGEPDLVAALALCRRRRMGPYRQAEAREAHRLRDLAALGRAGFGYDVATRALDTPEDES